MSTPSNSQVTDRSGQQIHEGDRVTMKAQGGWREGDVGEIVTSAEHQTEKGVKNTPKVLLTDQ
ncbi:hypothetical protein D9758_008009 [Tetrapyrgos nigripes]|uniref:Hypervirulence associated protein TUDOR domain-containing protein n=1 Tax=Tetrapyrgos nigripes TaxID=182062 RepID=A0A8H5D0G9_9AGAR|nr:hypothetical protein D9758_008009 [Tetrapyrgos nigripes]